MRSLVRASMFLLGIALLGSIATVAFYIIAAIGTVAAIVGVVYLLMGRRWDGRRKARLEEFEREQREGVSAPHGFGALDEDVFATRPDVPTVPEELRDPAWASAVQARADQRLTLIRRYLSVSARYDHGRYGGGQAAEDLAAARDACYRLFRALPREVGKVTSHDGRLNHTTYNVEIEPPATEVLHLARSFATVTDCRYGHAAAHNIVGVTGLAGEGLRKLYADQPKGRIIRECGYCDPTTKWTERP